jgi:diguanylate cyclase (GGDEF)-like protein
MAGDTGDGADAERSAGVRTLAHGSLEDLITPRLDPGKACLIVIRGRSVGQMLELNREGEAVIGRAPDAGLAIDDVAVSRHHARIEGRRGGFALEDLESTNGLFVNGVRTAQHTLRDGDRIQIGTTTILKFCFQDDVEADYQRQLYDSATRDSLTRTYNRKFFVENLEVDFAHARKNGSVLSLLLLDIDHFKSVNDRFGHLAGDDVLRETTAVIQRSLRPEDILARYGGEEFAVLLRFTDPQFALNVAERVRRAIEAQSFAYGGREFGITASVGQTTLIGNNVETPRELLEAADAALYEAKAQGRNRTVARVRSSRSRSGGRVSSEDPDATMRGRRTPITGDPEPEPPPVSRTARTIEVPLIDAEAIAAEPADPRAIDDKPKRKGRGPAKDPK